MEFKKIPHAIVEAATNMIKPYSLSSFSEEDLVMALIGENKKQEQSRLRELVTTKETAQSLKVSERTVYNLIKSGGLERIKIGRATRITSSSLEAYISMNTSRGGDHVE